MGVRNCSPTLADVWKYSIGGYAPTCGGGNNNDNYKMNKKKNDDETYLAIPTQYNVVPLNLVKLLTNIKNMFRK